MKKEIVPFKSNLDIRNQYYQQPTEIQSNVIAVKSLRFSEYKVHNNLNIIITQLNDIEVKNAFDSFDSIKLGVSSLNMDYQLTSQKVADDKVKSKKSWNLY